MPLKIIDVHGISLVLIRTIYLNIGHAAYHNMEAYPDLQMTYLREQMLKQYVLLYLSEGRYDMFGDIDNNFKLRTSRGRTSS